jgi:hypothetical protein
MFLKGDWFPFSYIYTKSLGVIIRWQIKLFVSKSEKWSKYSDASCVWNVELVISWPAATLHVVPLNFIHRNLNILWKSYWTNEQFLSISWNEIELFIEHDDDSINRIVCMYVCMCVRTFFRSSCFIGKLCGPPETTNASNGRDRSRENTKSKKKHGACCLFKIHTINYGYIKTECPWRTTQMLGTRW